MTSAYSERSSTSSTDRLTSLRQAQQGSWRDLETQPWGDTDRVVVSGAGPMYVNVLEAQDAYYVIGEFYPADCDHVEVVVDEEEDMLAIQFDPPYASPFRWVDDWGDVVTNDGPAARIHLESPGRFVRWVELSEDADLGRVSARYPRNPLPSTQWPSEAVVVRVAKLKPPQPAIRAVDVGSRHE